MKRQPMTGAEADQYAGLVRSIAAEQRNMPRHIDLCDLVSAGTVGLLEAWRAFNQNNGVKFATYARRAIWWAIKREVRGRSPDIDERQDVDALRATGPDPRDSLECSEAVGALRRAIDTGLTDGQASVMRLISRGRTRSEIVEELGMTIKGYEHRRARGIRKLRGILSGK